MSPLIIFFDLINIFTLSFVDRVALTLIILIVDMLLKVINLKKEKINGEG
jgi:hypothetical protein